MQTSKLASSSKVSLVPRPSPQFVHLSWKRGKVAAVTTPVRTGDRGEVAAVNGTRERREAAADTHNPDSK